MGLIELLIIILLIGAVVSAPAWPYARDWGYRPTGILWALLLVIVLVYFFGGYHHHWFR